MAMKVDPKTTFSNDDEEETSGIKKVSALFQLLFWEQLLI
jgi:hypothetical protein